MSNFLLPLITIPTQIIYGTNTLIDNIFTNHLHPDMKTGNLSIKISDHLPSFMIFLHKIKITFQKNTIYTLVNAKTLTMKIFYLIILKLTGNNTIEIDKEDVNHSLSKFMEKINVLLDKYMP